MKKVKIMPLTIDRVKISLLSAVLLIPTISLSVLAQAAPEVAIDRIFRYESSSSGNSNLGNAIGGLKKWLGAYQRIIREDNNYVAVFDRASLHLIVELKDSGEFKSFAFGCPLNRSISTSEAPEEFQKLIAKCNAFK